MKSYRKIDVTETQLEDFIRRSPENIEDGLAFVDHQAFTDRGPLDILMTDSGKSLIVAELKVVEDDLMLVQGIDYYDYIIRNLDGYARAYKQFDIDPSQEPRLFLIAPSFSVTLLKRIKWINIPISLFTYQCIEFTDEKGEIIPIFDEVTPPGLPEKVEAYSLEDRYNYITDKKVRALAKSLVLEMLDWNPERMLAEATKYSISIKLDGRVVAYIEPRRKHFLLSTYDTEGKWTNQQINSQNDVDAFQPIVLSNFERILGSNKSGL